MKKFGKAFLVTVLMGLMLLLMGCGGPKQEQVVVYNWIDYISPEAIQAFEQETGIKVKYEMFATNEDMYAKIRAGGSAYDVLFPSDYMVEKLIKENLLMPLDKAQIPNIGNTDPRFMGKAYDPEDQYSVPYMWGTVGIIYNKSMVTDPVDSWSILWNPKYAKQIIMLNSPRDSLGVALKLLGYSLNTQSAEELKAAGEKLKEQKPLVLGWWVDEAKDKMIAGEAALSVAWSGDAIAMINENPDLAYAIPKEGTNLWFDAMVIPQNAPNPTAAHKFIDFMCRPEIAKMNVEYICFSTPNQAAFDLLDPETQNDTNAYPADAALENTEVFQDPGDFLKEYDLVWTEVRGQ